ncbi:VOC family protein [Nocardia uniformis]|uniref:VOC family protein n=1 Tax=Nocardia uniformis TaxID=53432 RepID=A0A849C182_9NOCA|nr:VOC family protein [Nocardia uniformis]NNH71236.1 VOC family protein [Nocardia uniformis]
MTAIAKLGAVSLDSRDPHRLAQFYRELLEFEVRYESDELVVLQGAGVMVTVERVADHQPPNWPGNEVPKQMHLDLFVTDLDAAERAAIEIGAVRAEFQPAADQWRVLIDPSGHPFCLTLPPSAFA